VTGVGFIFYIYYALFLFFFILLYYIYHYIIIHLDKILKPSSYPTQRTQRKTISEAWTQSAQEAQRKRRSIIVIASVRCVDENL